MTTETIDATKFSGFLMDKLGSALWDPKVTAIDPLVVVVGAGAYSHGHRSKWLPSNAGVVRVVLGDRVDTWEAVVFGLKGKVVVTLNVPAERKDT